MNHSRINEIDLLRFFAALAVVFFHYAFRGYAGDAMSIMPYPALAPAAKYGYMGVELFFMISGFVIVLSIKSESARRFIISRAVRLYPALWICCTLTFFAIVIFGYPRYQATLGQYVATMFLVSDFIGVANVESAYWSLFVELKFYAIILVVILLRKGQYLENIMLAWLVIAGACELAGWEKGRIYLITDYAAYFVAGANFYWIRSAGSNLRRQLTTLLCLALCLYHTLNFGNLLESIYKTDFSPIILSCIILSFFIAMHMIAYRKSGWLASNDWSTLGALTYPLYLAHQTLGFIIFNSFYSGTNAHVLFCLTTLAMICLAWLVSKFFEPPIAQHLKRALNKSLRVVPLKDN